jgi:aryl-alcohol dehydrogenase-like predicted oxidoreductase
MTITKRTLGGRDVNPIGLGCMNICHAYGPAVDDEYAIKLLNRALDLGYDHLDTARIYGGGKSEELIGTALKGRRKDFYLASKMGIFFNKDFRGVDCKPETIRAQCENSLKLLQTDHIDLYYMHRRDFNVPIEDSVGAMADLVKEGKILGYGLSEMGAETVRRAHATHPCTALQTEYSLMTRNPEIAVLDVCKELGITFVAFSSLGRGFLSDGFKAMSDPQWAEGDLRVTWNRFMEPHYSANMKLIEQFRAFAADEGMTTGQLANGWVHAQGDHIVTIPGTQKISHLEENIARWDYQPSAELCARLDALINQKTVSGPRYTPALQGSIDTEVFDGEFEPE